VSPDFSTGRNAAQEAAYQKAVERIDGAARAAEGERRQRRADTCRSCTAAVFWAISAKTGRRALVDASPVEDGNVVVEAPTEEGSPPTFRVLSSAEMAQRPLDGTPRFKLHFATCPDAQRYRSKGRR